jgi:hypothetical protein
VLAIAASIAEPGIPVWLGASPQPDRRNISLVTSAITAASS